MQTPAHQGRTFVAYLRVSTDRQGRSGLGLEAQQTAIDGFIAQTPGAQLLAPPFVEVESGRKDERPQLAAAMERCRRTGATLLIAKLDRLARDAHFLLSLQKAGVDFVAADMPHANRLTVGIMALVAEEEARAISARTKAALAAAKARGVQLGGRRERSRDLTRSDAVRGAQHSAAVRSAASTQLAHRTLQAINAARAEGAKSLRQLADRLNAWSVPTARGNGTWTATAVRRVLLKTVE
jgi:DNA invertase Pin-like site-specific DNA recombinase